jgi:hypothetical protein
MLVKRYESGFHKKASMRQGDRLLVDPRRYNRYLWQGDPQYKKLVRDGTAEDQFNELFGES